MGVSVLGAKRDDFFAKYFEKYILFIISGLEMNRIRIQGAEEERIRERMRRGREARQGRDRDTQGEEPIKGWPRPSLVRRCPFDERPGSTSSSLHTHQSLHLGHFLARSCDGEFQEPLLLLGRT